MGNRARLARLFSAKSLQWPSQPCPSGCFQSYTLNHALHSWQWLEVSVHVSKECVFWKLLQLLIILQINSEIVLTHCRASLFFLSSEFKRHFIIRTSQELHQSTLSPDMQMTRKSENTGLSSLDPPCCCWSSCTFSWHGHKLANRWLPSFLCVVDMVPTIWLCLGDH